MTLGPEQSGQEEPRENLKEKTEKEIYGKEESSFSIRKGSGQEILSVRRGPYIIFEIVLADESVRV